MQIRANAESAAFYRCGRVEQDKANARLDKLVRTQQRLVLREYFLNCKSAFLIRLASSKDKVIFLYSTVSWPLDRSKHFTPQLLPDLLIPAVTQLLWEAF